MKTLQLGKFYPPFHGGMETVLRDLCRGLSSIAGHEIRVLCAEHSKNSSSNKDGEISILRLPSLAILFSQPLMTGYFSQLKKQLQWADIVHLHAPHPLAEMALLFANPNCPIIITHHSDVVRQRFLAPIHALLVNALYSRAKAIVVPTSKHISSSRVLRRFAHKCHLIPFALNTDSLIPPENISAKQTKGAIPYFLFVGRLVGYKGVEVLLHAFANVETKFNLKIIGTGPLKDDLIGLAKSLNLLDRVEFLGRVDSQESFSELYAHSTALVLPSITSNENFGMVQLEAMYYSKPIIATDLNSGVPAVAEPGVSSILAKPNDPISLSLAMNELAKDSSKAQLMGLAARKRYEEMYQLESFIQSHQELYDELLKESH